MTLDPTLRQGTRGGAVWDLQQRLIDAGLALSGDPAGSYGDATERAVRAFQEGRGLRVDGICGRETWTALVESGFTLGDRLLYLRQPMLRGDDVSQLQQRLNALGFDAGRQDGILGPRTAHGLLDFQRNAGLAADGILGPATLATLERLGSLARGSVAEVREREFLRHAPRHLEGRRVFLAVFPGLEALGDEVERSLTTLGARTLSDDSGLDEHALADEANRFEADLFLGLRHGDRVGCRCAYFGTATFRSQAGERFAASIQHALATVMDADPAPVPRTYTALRETRMAGVVCEPVGIDDLPGMERLVNRVGDAGTAIARGVRSCLEADEEMIRG